jgi:hypothetical protein
MARGGARRGTARPQVVKARKRAHKQAHAPAQQAHAQAARPRAAKSKPINNKRNRAKAKHHI